jgi:hypothetical protein
MKNKKFKFRKRRKGESQKAYMIAWHAAYNAVYEQLPNVKIRRAAYAQSPKARMSKAAYARSPKGKASQAKGQSAATLRKAIKESGPVLNGWPDAGLQEQKTGADCVSIGQWRRAAELWLKGIVIYLRFATTHEDALHDKRCRIISFADYAKEIGCLKEWNNLKRKLKIGRKEHSA